MRPPQPELGPERLYDFLDALWQRREIAGDVLEIGCFRGGTTRVAFRFLQATQPTRRYVAVDTFAGFVDGQFEHDRMHGTAARFRKGFSVNGLGAVRRSLEAEGLGAVRLVEGDIGDLPDSELPSVVAVCLLDVDLEIPTHRGLCRVADRLAPGGIVLVDDCDPGCDYPGALMGYRRFASEHDMPEEYFMTMGILRSALSP